MNSWLGEINTQMRKREIREESEIDYSVLSADEVSRIAGMINEALRDGGLETDIDAVAEQAGLYVEDVPGLEDPIAAEKAIVLIVNAYRETHL